MTQNLTQLEVAVNEYTCKGAILDAIAEHYADNCVFVESDGSSRQCKAEQVAHLNSFFGTLKSFDGAQLYGSASSDNYATSEWTFNMMVNGGSKIEWNEVLVRSWAALLTR